MESLAPTLQLCIEVRMLVERGESIYIGTRRLLEQIPLDVRYDLIRLFFQFDQDRGLAKNFETKSVYRKEVLRIIWAGLSGEPIAGRLKEVELEIQGACEEEIETFVSRLPIRAMLPVLLMQFPAFLILVFSPIVEEITRSFIK